MRISLSIALISSLACLGSGCATTGISLDPVLASNSSEMAVYNPSGPFVKGKLNFGPYSVWEVEESAAQGQDDSAKTESYSFWMTDEWSRHWETQCKRQMRKASRASGAAEIVSLNCEIAGADDVEKSYAWGMKLTAIQNGPSVRMGKVKNARHEMRIESHYGDGKRKAVGFDIYMGDKPVASIKTTGEGSIWIHDHLAGDVRSAVAATATGLLLFDRALGNS